MNRTLPTFEDGENHVKISHFTRKGLDIKGLIHIGINDWYEYDQYIKMGIWPLLGFEPLLGAIQRFKQAHPEIPNVEKYLIPVALGNMNTLRELYVTSGDGQSSSFFEMTPEYNADFPDIDVLKAVRVPMYRYADLANTGVFDSNEYNCLVLDAEGYELNVLTGMSFYIKGFEMLSIELSGKQTYYGGPLAGQVVEYLQEWGFVQDSPIEDHNDVMFLRKDIYDRVKGK